MSLRLKMWLLSGLVVVGLLGIVSVGLYTPDWGWVVGTGIGFDEANARFWDSALQQIGFCLALLVLILVPVQLTTRAI